MARETLPTALELVFGHEGGVVNAKTDRSGPTKYGITQKTLAAHRGVNPPFTKSQHHRDHAEGVTNSASQVT